MNHAELQEILRLHSMWLRGEDGGARANLSDADISEADLSRANLSRANLTGADLSGADLSGANLRGANLRVANLYGASLSGAVLRGANLSGTSLSLANLREADLSEANLSLADISEANLSGAIDGAVCRMDFGGWSICIRAIATSIGCQQHVNEQWLAWSPDDVAYMHADARDWWAVHGDAVKAVIRCVMAKAAKEKEVT